MKAIVKAVDDLVTAREKLISATLSFNTDGNTQPIMEALAEIMDCAMILFPVVEAKAQSMGGGGGSK